MMQLILSSPNLGSIYMPPPTYQTTKRTHHTHEPPVLYNEFVHRIEHLSTAGGTAIVCTCDEWEASGGPHSAARFAT